MNDKQGAEKRAQLPSERLSLKRFTTGRYCPGRNRLIRILWYLIAKLLFERRLFVFYPLKRVILRCFGARIGIGVVIKPGVRIKYPWKLEIGDYSWIGEDTWIDNLAIVRIGNDVCISQDVYLCTGSHRFDLPTFDLQVLSIEIDDGSWVATRSTVLPGVRIGKSCLCAAGSVVQKSVADFTKVGGVPARELRASGAPKN